MNYLKLIQTILNIFFGNKFPRTHNLSKPAPQPEPRVEPKPESRPEAPVYIEYITLQDWVTSSGRFKDREKSPELTKEVLNNAKITVKLVNNLLNDLKWNEKVIVSSGFRPSAVNANIPNAARRSPHMTGLAIDIQQPKDNNRLGLLIRQEQLRNSILKKHGLMMEAIEHTVGQNTSWVHLDRVNRPDRKNREFNP